MGAAEVEREYKTDDLSSDDRPKTGRFIDNKSRSVQDRGRAESQSLYINLTDTGTSILGVTSEDTLNIVIYSNGIWIPRQ